MSKWIVRIKKSWIVTQLAFIMLMSFFAIFIPLVAGLLYTINKLGWFEYDPTLAFTLFIILLFGFLFIALSITYVVGKIFVEIFEFDRKFKELSCD